MEVAGPLGLELRRLGFDPADRDERQRVLTEASDYHRLCTVRQWGGCHCIRIGVLRVNARALPFWEAVGFSLTGEVFPYTIGDVKTTVAVLEKQLG